MAGKLGFVEKSRQRVTRALVFLAVLTLALLWARVTTAADPILLERYGLTLFGIEVALAVFSVNLSLVIFQLSPYRQLITGLSGRHLSFAASVLMLSLLPLVLSQAGCGGDWKSRCCFKPTNCIRGLPRRPGRAT